MKKIEKVRCNFVTEKNYCMICVISQFETLLCVRSTNVIFFIFLLEENEIKDFLFRYLFFKNNNGIKMKLRNNLKVMNWCFYK